MNTLRPFYAPSAGGSFHLTPTGSLGRLVNWVGRDYSTYSLSSWTLVTFWVWTMLGVNTKFVAFLGQSTQEVSSPLQPGVLVKLGWEVINPWDLVSWVWWRSSTGVPFGEGVENSVLFLLGAGYFEARY